MDESLNVLCSICNESYNSNHIICSTSNCGHVFHKECLFLWLSGSQTCPQCHTICHRQRVNRIYLSFADRTEVEEVESLQIQWLPIDLSFPLAYGDLKDAVKCGTDHQGFDTYVARAPLGDNMIPSNFVPETRAVHAPWDGRNNRLTEVELLISTDCELEWVHAEYGHVPSNALKTGHTESGESLYTGRVIYENRTVIGKIHPSWRCLFIPNRHVELKFRRYEVLVVKPNEQPER
ncbi:uncharacterized protein LOC117787505 [Drosophila innubila]|uniref:uncharacterized protein LOC117787505 n=1 Tax=Drosophila innubila TaxID=198719 RepID=UPI00148CBE39|nr:uncharacterized protein LOC117787505 [Drosophila innubila]